MEGGQFCPQPAFSRLRRAMRQAGVDARRTVENHDRAWPSWRRHSAGTLPAALPLLAAQASCARLSRLKAGCGQNCPPSKALHRFSSLTVGRRPIPTGLEARPTCDQSA
jgi:hypothetical protein